MVTYPSRQKLLRKSDIAPARVRTLHGAANTRAQVLPTSHGFKSVSGEAGLTTSRWPSTRGGAAEVGDPLGPQRRGYMAWPPSYGARQDYRRGRRTLVRTGLPDPARLQADSERRWPDQRPPPLLPTPRSSSRRGRHGLTVPPRRAHAVAADPAGPVAVERRSEAFAPLPGGSPVPASAA